MSGDFGAWRKILVLALFVIASCPGAYAQVPCPVALVSAKAEKDSIQLEFLNKGKVPVEQLSLACSPSANNEFADGTCHVENGIFYPGTVSWIKIDYPAANRHAIEISVAGLRLAGGIVWQPSSSRRCKVLLLPRKN